MPSSSSLIRCSGRLGFIAAQALAHRMPSISALPDYAELGGLMSYGTSLVDNYRRAATYVDRILKGANPGVLPFEQPTRYRLGINPTTRLALHLTIPQALLIHADPVTQSTIDDYPGRGQSGRWAGGGRGWWRA